MDTGYLSRTVSSSACVSSGRRPVSSVNTSIFGTCVAITSRSTMSSAPKLQAKVEGELLASSCRSREINSLVLAVRFILKLLTRLTPYNAGDAHHEQNAGKNAAHENFRQPRAEGAAEIDSWNRSGQQAKQQTIIDVAELQVSEPGHCHERYGVCQIGTDDRCRLQRRIKQHECGYADGSCPNRSQRDQNSQNDADEYCHPSRTGFAQGVPSLAGSQDPFS